MTSSKRLKKPEQSLPASASLTEAHKAYIDAFTHHAVYKMKDRLPKKQWREIMNNIMDRSPEWQEYQDAWLLEHAKDSIERRLNEPSKKLSKHGYHSAHEAKRATNRMKRFTQNNLLIKED